ncbi:outer membrane protein assembly factor BamD [Magnetospira thiophila]
MTIRPFSFVLSSLRTAGMALALIGLVSACGDKKPKEYIERPVEELYNQAQSSLENREFEEAAKQFDEVERQHPYSKWATRAQIMAAFSSYMHNAYDEAIVALDRFLQLHPSHADAPYALYLKALCYYEQISDVTRDQKMTALATQSLKDVISRFPASRYARDAQIKLDLTIDHLAGKQMEIGRYYLHQGHYLAAINRFKRVVEEYQTTTHVPEALHRLVEAYLALGVTDEAKRTAAVLGHNFPGSEWYIDSFEMVENKTFRRPNDEEEPWYQIWDSQDDEPRVIPNTEKASPPWWDVF